jgi:predicted DCC family thiol-disulfide oxidoreductase YuxK
MRGFELTDRLVVWFDGSCPFCRREIALTQRLDRRGAIDFVDIASDSTAECPVDRAQLISRFHAREDGRLLSGAEAFAAMWRAIPLLRPFGLLARVRIIHALLERCYVAFLGFRPALQRLIRSAEQA